MKHRITYLRDPQGDDDFDPRQTLKVWKNSMRVSDLVAAKEHRVTFALSELPEEIVRLLRQCSELRIRWTTTRPYKPTIPLVSRTSPGLHVFYKPMADAASTDLCPGLKTIFGQDIKCESSEHTFSTPSIPSNSTTPLLQYYTLLPSLQTLSIYLAKFCPSSGQKCLQAATSLLTADYLDIDYDKSSSSLILTTFFAIGPQSGTWEETIDYPGHERVEVGLLHQEDSEDKDEIRMGGWLTVVGYDKNPKPTLFSFPSRHHLLPRHSSFITTLDTPTGLHPTLRISLPKSSLLTPPNQNPSCKLHTHLTLPSSLFIDRHAFSDPLVLASHNLAALRSVSGATDLEAPDWMVSAWGPAALFEIDTSSPTTTTTTTIPSSSTSSAMGKDRLDVTIPLHLRYLTPTRGGYSNTSIPYPVVFWACSPLASDPAAFKPSENPFDRRTLGYDGLFSEGTVFHHFQPVGTAGEVGAAGGAGGGGGGGDLTISVGVPVLDLSRGWYVEGLTALVVVMGVLWLVWKFVKPIPKEKVAKVRKA